MMMYFTFRSLKFEIVTFGALFLYFLPKRRQDFLMLKKDLKQKGNKKHTYKEKERETGNFLCYLF